MSRSMQRKKQAQIINITLHYKHGLININMIKLLLVVAQDMALDN